MKSFHIVVLLIIFCLEQLFASQTQIKDFSGQVKIRAGLEENWQPAVAGMFLKDIDTILTGEDGMVVLRIHENKTFELGPNTMLDISDLRNVSNDQVFLYVMNMKLQKLRNNSENTPLRIGNVSTVHGASRDTSQHQIETLPSYDWHTLMKNGVRALFEQQFYPNTVLKIFQVFELHAVEDECAEFQYYLGRSFEMMGKPGQAMDAYQKVLEHDDQKKCAQSAWKKKAEAGLEDLASEQ